MLHKREVIGFIVAPLPFLAPFLVMFAVLFFDDPSELLVTAHLAATILVWSYGATLLVGMPVHLTLRRKGKRGLIAYLGLTFVGALVACAGAAIAEKLFIAPQEDNPFALTMWSSVGVKVTVLFAVLASICACIFWAIAVRRSPGQGQ